MDKQYTDEEYDVAFANAEGRDKVGVLGEILTTGVGTAGGLAGSAAIASVAGATTTTFMGSSLLGGVLGVGVVTTPVGWVIGCAVASTALTYGLTRMIKSGVHNDQVRIEVVNEIIKRKKAEILQKRKNAHVNHLKDLLDTGVSQSKIAKEKSEQLLGLVTNNKLNVQIALKRVKGLLQN
jgi:hypothetical protein